MLFTRRSMLSTAIAPALTGFAQRRPNVVFVLADQWRAQAFGYAGDRNAATPAIDALAGESVNFTNAVSGFPVCSPYRASLMTGQYAVRHGVVVNDVPLQPKGSTLAQSFRDAGYETAYIGKWHLFGSPGGKFERRLAPIPADMRLGFQYWKACECTHDYNKSLYYSGDSTEPRYWEGYDARSQTQDACEFIRERGRSSEPYFLLLSLGPPHDPYHTAPRDIAERYASRTIELRPNIPSAMSETAQRDLRGYYAHAEALDGCVRRVREALQSSGVAEDTIFVFASDHGDMLCSQGLTRKQYPWDESIRVPFLAHYPSVLGKRQRKLKTPIDAPDVMPTLLGLAGVRVPDSVQGKDFSGLMNGRIREEAEPAALLNLPVSFSVIRRAGFAEYRGLRTARYTFARSLAGPWLLYDNASDPWQKRNLSGVKEHSELQGRLERELDRRLKVAGDDFLPGSRYVEQAKVAHYREVSAPVGHTKSPWGDWQSTLDP